jgi:hypothetical protein
MPVTPPPLPDEEPLARARALMRDGGGVLSRKDALGAGLTPGQVQTLLRREDWLVVHRGRYAEADADVDAGTRHALEVAGKSAALNGTWAASHRSAALVLGIPVLGRPPSPVQLVRAPDLGRRRDVAKAPGLHVARLDADDLVECRGVLVTSPARTVADLSRTRPFREGVVAADAVLHAGLPPTELERMAHSCKDWPGARQMLRVLAFADERAESPLESLDRIAFAEHGLPRPRTQIDVIGPSGLWMGRTDFLFEEQRTVVEPDGLAKYRLAAGSTVPPWAERALTKEKQRESGLRQCGLEVVRNDWDEAFRRGRDLAERVRQHFGFAARYPAVPGVVFVEAPVRRRGPPTWPLPASGLATPKGKRAA